MYEQKKNQRGIERGNEKKEGTKGQMNKCNID